MSTPGALSVWWPRERRATHWRCGAGRRLTMSPRSHSLRWRSAGCEELRLAAVELADRARSGRRPAREVIGELEALVAEEPLRERLHALRMLALYRCGRQADALDAYREARAALVEAIGVEPGPELRRLHEAILRQDPTLEPPTVEAVELPPELDAPDTAGRARGRTGGLREHWRRAHGGAGRRRADRGRARDRQDAAGGTARPRGPSRPRRRALRLGRRRSERHARGARDAGITRRPTLLVLDDVDRAAEASASRSTSSPAAWRAAGARAGDRRGRRRCRADATLRARPARRRRRARGGAALRGAARGHRAARRAARRGERRCAWAGAPRGAASGHAPRRHGAWARPRSAQPRERTGLRATEDELAGDVVELQAVRERAELQDGRPRSSPARSRASPPSTSTTPTSSSGASGWSPRWWRASSARRWSAIVGPSGSGKSSALRAGLLAALRAGVLPGQQATGRSRCCGRASTRCAALEQATAQASPHGR